VAIADVPSQSTTTQDAPPTHETSSLPRVPDRSRRHATATLPRLAPGRYLAVEDGEELVLMELTEANLRIGRSPAADLVLEDPSVSRRHAVLTRRGGQTVVLDDRSMNGVVVNGVRRAEATLAHGDRVTLGRVTMRYVEIDDR
jgi:pSer/pThr/pTyr-binding forkhead associated (FHA) protein